MAAAGDGAHPANLAVHADFFHGTLLHMVFVDANRNLGLVRGHDLAFTFCVIALVEALIPEHGTVIEEKLERIYGEIPKGQALLARAIEPFVKRFAAWQSGFLLPVCLRAFR